MEHQYIYVIASTPVGPCKIGISDDPDRRVKQLQTGHPEPLFVYHREHVGQQSVKLIESIVHRDMRHLRQRGEWFRLTVEEAMLQVQWTMIHYGDVENLKEKVKRGQI